MFEFLSRTWEWWEEGGGRGRDEIFICRHKSVMRCNKTVFSHPLYSIWLITWRKCGSRFCLDVDPDQKPLQSSPFTKEKHYLWGFLFLQILKLEAYIRREVPVDKIDNGANDCRICWCDGPMLGQECVWRQFYWIASLTGRDQIIFFLQREDN